MSRRRRPPRCRRYYGPNVNVGFSAYNDEFAKAAEAKTQSAFLDAVTGMQKIVIEDLKDSGFTVK